MADQEVDVDPDADSSFQRRISRASRRHSYDNMAVLREGVRLQRSSVSLADPQSFSEAISVMNAANVLRRSMMAALVPSYTMNPHNVLSDRVIIAMVGLPARGKSYISKAIGVRPTTQRALEVRGAPHRRRLPHSRSTLPEFPRLPVPRF